MNNNEWYIIKDLEHLTNYSRMLVFNNFGSKQEEQSSEIIDFTFENLPLSEKDELDKILSYNESLAIVKSLIKLQKNKKTKEIRYLLSDESYMEILTSLGDRMTSNILQGLVQKGLVETAYDSEANDFVFWIKDYVKKDFEKPETD